METLQHSATCVLCAMLLFYVEAMSVKEAQEILSGPGDFALQAFKELAKIRKGYNTLISVCPLVRGLALLYEAAAGSTEKEMMKTIGFPADRHLLRKAHHMASNTVREAVGPTGVFNTATRMFVDDKIEVLPSYERVLEEFYSASVERLNFENIHTAAGRVNWWAKIRTNYTITSVITAEDMGITPHGLLMVSTLYYKGRWKVPFSPEATDMRLFRLTPKEAINVPMMFTTGEFLLKHCPERKVTFISFPYEGSKLSLIVVLPDPDCTTDDFLNTVDHWPEERLMADVQPEVYEVFLPKFFVENTVQLNKVVHKLGLLNMFTSAANLTRLSMEVPLGVDNIVQKTRFEVTEEGAIAAASQSVGISWKNDGVEQVIVDHPFMFIVLEEELNLPLIFGKIERPSHL